MFGGKIQPRLNIRNRGARRFGERDHVAKPAGHAPHILRQQHRPFGGNQPVRDFAKRLHVGRDFARALSPKPASGNRMASVSGAS